MFTTVIALAFTKSHLHAVAQALSDLGVLSYLLFRTSLAPAVPVLSYLLGTEQRIETERSGSAATL